MESHFLSQMTRARGQSLFHQCLPPQPFRVPLFSALGLHFPSLCRYHKSCNPAPLSMEILISQGKSYPLLQLPTESSWALQLAEKTKLFHKSGVNAICFHGCPSPFCSLKLSLKTAPLCVWSCGCKGWCGWQPGAHHAEYTAVSPRWWHPFVSLSTQLLIFIKSVEMQIMLREQFRGIWSLQMRVCSLPWQ